MVVIEIYEAFLEGTDQHGTLLEQFLIQNCTCKMDRKLIFVYLSITCLGFNVDVRIAARLSLFVCSEKASRQSVKKYF